MGTEEKGSGSDRLAATTPEGKIELTEQELNRTTGGTETGQKVKIKFTSTTKDKVETFPEF